MELVNPIKFTLEEVETFQKQRALTMRNIFTPEGIKALQEMVELELGPTTKTLGKDGDFKRMKYDVGNKHELTRSLIGSVAFKKLIHQLIPTRLIFTQGLAFELAPGKVGLDWHFGFISFSYIEALSDAYSIWIPFNKIDPTEQGGGIQYIPADAYSGRDRMVLTCQHVLAGPQVIEDMGGVDKYREMMPCSNADKALFNQECVEPSLEPGDAFIFNRFVWHKSSVLKEGALDKRLALVLRFVDADARYHRTLCEKLADFAISYGNPNTKTEYGLSFTDIKDGDRMIDSKFSVDIV